MSDSSHIVTIHGVEVDSKGHDRAVAWLQNHCGDEEFRERIHNAKNSSDHNSHFFVVKDGHNIEYVLKYHDGKLKIRSKEDGF